MNNKDPRMVLPALNDYLMNTLEEITNSDLKGEALNEALNRAKTVTQIANSVVHNNTAMMALAQMQIDYGSRNVENLLLGGKGNERS